MNLPVATLETPRFILRRLAREDAAALLPTLSDEEQCRYLSRRAFADEDELAAWLLDPDWNGRSWVAVDRQSGDIAGRFVLVPTDDPQVAEIGYITAMQWQGKGVASECMAALIANAFAAEGHRRLIADIDARNLPSIALAEKLGFKQEGCLREHEMTHSGLCDLLIYGLLRREWESA